MSVVFRCPGCGALASSHSEHTKPTGWAVVQVDWGAPRDFFQPSRLNVVCSTCAGKVEAIVAPLPLAAPREEP